MEELSSEAFPHIQPRRRRARLPVNAKSPCAQEERAERETFRRERQTRHRADAARKLQHTGEKCPEEGKRSAGAEGKLSGERIRKAERGERREQRGKEHDICADLEKRLRCGGDGSAERRAEIHRRLG